jgi:hypothetical protein
MKRTVPLGSRPSPARSFFALSTAERQWGDLPELIKAIAGLRRVHLNVSFLINVIAGIQQSLAGSQNA